MTRWKTVAVAGALMAAAWAHGVDAQTPPPAPNPQVQQDRKDLRKDRRDIREDRREIRGDRKEDRRDLSKDKKAAGGPKTAAAPK